MDNYFGTPMEVYLVKEWATAMGTVSSTQEQRNTHFQQALWIYCENAREAAGEIGLEVEMLQGHETYTAAAQKNKHLCVGQSTIPFQSQNMRHPIKNVYRFLQI